MLTHPRRVPALLGAAGLVATALVVAVPAPSRAEPGADCSGLNDSLQEVDITDTEPSGPYGELQVADAQQLLESRGLRPGQGVRVAVVDSGISGNVGWRNPVVRPPVPVVRAIVPETTAIAYHGTAVAGVIAGEDREDGGPVGVAPAATLIDVSVYNEVAGDTSSSDSEATPLSLDNVVAGIRQATAADADIINISLGFAEGSPQLVAALRDAVAGGAVVVASTGNRPRESADLLFGRFGGDPEGGEDAAGAVYPAAYAAPGKRHVDGLVAVNSTVSAGDPAVYVLPNSDTTVAAPSEQVVTYAVSPGDVACRLVEPSTSMAAAEVSGVLALLKTRFPNESPVQLVKRLTDTAAGSTRNGEVRRDRFTGYGVVQPLEALTRQLVPGGRGDVPRSKPFVATPEAATVAGPEDDPLAEPRNDAVWWGLVGGGALVVAALLRPVLARRRRG